MDRLVSSCIRFGPFEVSPDSGELRKNGRRLKLSGQAVQVLVILIENPGQVVAREELQKKLWPGASFGDFDHGLNAAVNRLRDVLGDSVAKPKFIETVPRHGYRFIGQLEPELAARETTPPVELGLGKRPTRSRLRRHWRRISTAGAVLLFGIGGYVLVTHPANTSQERVVPFTTYLGYEGAPSFSPDGNEIAFSWSREDGTSTALTTDLYIKQIGNENAVRLTNHQAQFLVPAWSPDGRNIAFSMMGKNGNGVYLIPALGGRERRLAEIRPNGWQWLLLSWSPDSRWLAFASDLLPDKPANATPRYRIHLLNVESGEERVLPDPAADCTVLIEPSISPDGKSLASVCVLALGINKLYVQRIDGELPREIAQIDTSFVLAGIAWSADGHSILYSTYGTTGRLWRVSAEGGRPQQISVAHGTESPAVARVGNKLAYAQTNYPYDIWSIGLSAGMSAQKPFRLVSSTWDQANARISPDGKLIAFDSSRSGNYEIWVCDRDGSKPVQLSFFDGPVTGDPRWSPDGRQVVFNSKVSGQPQSYIVAVDGGKPKRLETGTSTALSPSWSSDGRWIYFATEQPNGVWKVPPGGGAAVRLTSEGAYPQESADGKRVFYVVGGARGKLWSASVSGSDARAEDGVPVLLNPLSWAPDQTGIYFVDGAPWQYSIKYFSFSSRRTTKISDLNGISFLCCGITVDYDHNTLLFSAVERLESDIMLVENFH